MSKARSLTTLCLLAAAIVAAGCSGGSGGGDAAAATQQGEAPPPVVKQANSPAAPRPRALPSTLRVEPTELNLGTMATSTAKSSTIRLTNTGSEPITIQDCVSSCGCTNTNCPKGQALKPGESADVTVTVNGGARAHHVAKTVTFRVVDQQSVIVPVTVDVIAYLKIDPEIIDPEVVTDGKVTISSTDGQPFRITGANPPVVKELPPEPATQQVVFIDWDAWRKAGKSRRIWFDVSHPDANQISTLVRHLVPPRSGEGQDDSGPDPIAVTAIRNGDLDKLADRLATGLKQPGLNDLLGLASRHGRADMMAMLIESGADVNAGDTRGRTPLMAAVQSRSVDALQLLIDKGADVNARDAMNSTALLRAAGAFGEIDVVKLLVSVGADVNAKDNNGMTPLMWAARWGDVARVKALLDAGADPHVRDNTGQTALDWAYSRGEKAADTVALLKTLNG